MNKKQQRSKWLQRPLSEAQVQGAADDVIWLHPLKAVPQAEATERAPMAFVAEEQELLSTTVYPALAKKYFLKPSDLYHLSPREQYMAARLLRFRHEPARRLTAGAPCPKAFCRNQACAHSLKTIALQPCLQSTWSRPLCSASGFMQLNSCSAITG